MTAVRGAISLLATPALFLECEDVLKRQEQMEGHGLDITEINSVLGDLANLIQPVQVHFQWRPQLQDANDEMVLEAALNGGADHLITHNIADFRHTKKGFSLKVTRPGEFLREVRR